MGEGLRSLDGLEWETGHVKALAWSPVRDDDGSLLLATTGSRDWSARLWNVASGECLRTFSGHSKGVVTLAFSQDGKHLATGSWDKVAKVWEAATGACLRSFKHEGCVNSLAFSSNNFLATATRCLVKLWRAFGDPVEERTFEGHSDSVVAVAFSPINGEILATGSWDKTVRLWLSSDNCRILAGHERCVSSVVFSSSGEYLATGSLDNTARLWDVQSGACLRTFVHDHFVNSVALAPDDLYLATGTFDKEAKLWSVASGACLKTFDDHAACVTSVAFSPEGTLLATASNQKARLWHIQAFDTAADDDFVKIDATNNNNNPIEDFVMVI